VNDRYLGAADAVRAIQGAYGGEAKARRHIARECRESSLIAVAQCEVVRVSVSTAHRERFQLEEMQEIGRTLLDTMHLSVVRTFGAGRGVD